MSLFPVVAIQGARQTGKSYLARELLKKSFPHAYYCSFDHLATRNDATRAPQTFLLGHEESVPFVIDEAQKVPEIFDAIKFEVDQRRTPGRYLILGSTEFSRMAQIRESLTGRMGRIRLFPMTLGETLKIDKPRDSFRRQEVLQYLEYGGMPGFFSVRESDEREALIQDWLDLICLRDVHQFQSVRADGDVASALIRLASTLEEPSRAEMAKHIRVDPRRIETHLKILCELFVLQKLNPHASGTGKPIYLPLDAGVAKFLGASQMRCLHIFLMNERMAKNAYADKKRKAFYYYRSPGRQIIHFIEDGPDSPVTAFQLKDAERIVKTDAALMLAFLQKNSGANGRVFAPIMEPQKVDACQFAPWEEIASLVKPSA